VRALLAAVLLASLWIERDALDGFVKRLVAAVKQ
jgi:hypothetical protein